MAATVTEEEYEAVCTRVSYQPKGMFYAEVWIFLQACQRHACDLIIESGVKNGMSTRLLAACWHAPIISIDKKPVAVDAVFPGVQLLKGDSTELLPRLLEDRPERRVAVLIDGPKGSKAQALKDRCLRLSACRLVGVHDLAMFRGESEHSHDSSFALVRQRFDKYVSAEYRKAYPLGPGLGIWEKKP
jgi:hypothetical protein